MIGRLRRLLGRVLALTAVAVLTLLSPVAYVELACHGAAADAAYAPILPPADRRNEAATYLTYPEWHIVHAYDDYARVIATGDPHEFGYLRAIAGFWSSLCTLTAAADAHGGADQGTRLTIHTIGVSFTAELLLKAAYEDTAGRLLAALRGPARAPLDDLSAAMARRYAGFLQQVPWYRYDFAADIAALDAAAGPALRDRERRLTLGLEFGAKAAYARVIANAVGLVGEAELTIRSLVRGLDTSALGRIDGVTVIEDRPDGTVIETPRYRAFTHILAAIAGAGGEIVEIAGNDDILVSVIGPAAARVPGAIVTLPRQGYGDARFLLALKVADLAPALRAWADGAIRLEHVHDY